MNRSMDDFSLLFMIFDDVMFKVGFQVDIQVGISFKPQGRGGTEDGWKEWFRRGGTPMPRVLRNVMNRPLRYTR